MGDADQRLTALLGGLAAQLGDAEFGDHIVDVVLAGRHMGAGDSVGTMREMVSSLAVDGRTMKALPPLERLAARTKSDWPPVPE
jgi:hypothetical protein